VEILGRTSERGEVTASCWSQQATPERQQPTANERLLAVSKQHQRSNNLQPMEVFAASKSTT